MVPRVRANTRGLHKSRPLYVAQLHIARCLTFLDRYKMSLKTLFFLLPTLMGACTQTNATLPTGILGQPCRPASSCDPGLLCHRDTCIQLQRDPYEAERVDGIIPLASLGGPIDLTALNDRYLGTFLTEAGFYVFYIDHIRLVDRSGRQLLRLDRGFGEWLHKVVYDGTRFIVTMRGRDGPTVIFDDQLRELGPPPEAWCNPSPSATHSTTTHICGADTLTTYDHRTSEALDSGYESPDEPDRGFLRRPGGTDDRFVAGIQGWDVDHLFLFEDIAGRPPEVLAAANFVAVSRSEEAYWNPRSAILLMHNDELIGHWGESYNVSADCVQDGSCFAQVTPRTDQLYALAAAGADGSVLLAPDDRGIRELLDIRADPDMPPCSRCRFERWGPGAGERTSALIGLPRFRYENVRTASPSLFDDPWEGGAWIVVRASNPADLARETIEVYRVPL
ncbi:MAG: hypothetical protein ACI9OJ_005551 [Myxococcota bacterium]|jgi:hypothetical protein